MWSAALIGLVACSFACAASASAAPKKKAPAGNAATQTESPAARAAAGLGITSALKDIIKAKSAEFCAGHGFEMGCIEQAEICLSMVDRDGDPVHVCVSANMDENEGPRTARAKMR
jgi:hypothetical protein